MLPEKKVLAAALAAALALAGCGGGGDDKLAGQPATPTTPTPPTSPGTPTAPTTPDDPLAPSYVINESNMVQTAQQALGGLDALNGVLGSLSLFSETGVNQTPSLQASIPALIAERALKSWKSTRSAYQPSGGLRPQAVETDTYAC